VCVACRLIYLGIVVGLIVFIVLDVWVDTKRLTSLAGMILLLLLSFLTSNNPSKVCLHRIVFCLVVLLYTPVTFMRVLGDTGNEIRLTRLSEHAKVLDTRANTNCRLK